MDFIYFKDPLAELPTKFADLLAGPADLGLLEAMETQLPTEDDDVRAMRTIQRSAPGVEFDYFRAPPPNERSYLHYNLERGRANCEASITGDRVRVHLPLGLVEVRCPGNGHVNHPRRRMVERLLGFRNPRPSVHGLVDGTIVGVHGTEMVCVRG